MAKYSRFGIYYLPAKGPLAEFGAHWLGWDVEAGVPRAQPDVAEIREITRTPSKYGLHGTLKPPFRLADGTTAEDLAAAVEALAGALPQVHLDGLDVARLGQFLALTPVGDTSALARIAAQVVQKLDRFRAPAGRAEIERRRAAGLNERQDANLLSWGYPYVLEEFRFHITLTGGLTEPQIDRVHAVLKRLLPDIPAPFPIDEIALVGERASDGRFERIHRYALSR